MRGWSFGGNPDPQEPVTRRWVWLCLLAAALTAVYPCVRACLHAEVGYNEGWNVYAAMRLLPGAKGDAQLPGNLAASPLAGTCCETRLYPPGYGWTTVNYPAASFLLLAKLHAVTHDLLFTGRMLSLFSLLLSCVLVAGIARQLGAIGRAAVLSGTLLLSIFCLCATEYVGMDDPQMLGQAVSLAGVLVYLRIRSEASTSPIRGSRHEFIGILAAALLFVLAGCVKQNLIAFPLAVLLDLLLRSRARALWFAVCGIVFATVALRWNLWIGGPGFVQEMLLPRSYSGAKAVLMLRDVFGPLLLPLVLACVAAWRNRSNPSRRFAGLTLVSSLLIGGYFAGGAGVARNALFDALCAMAILLGIVLSGTQTGTARTTAVGPLWTELPLSRFGLVPLLFAWMTIPALVEGTWRPWSKIHESLAAQRRFMEEVNMLRAQPGPALCESMLLCAMSGKPFVYDPFNATRLIQLGRLDGKALVRELEQHRYGTVQMRLPPPGDELTLQRFSPDILQVIRANYTVVWQGSDSTILVPKL